MSKKKIIIVIMLIIILSSIGCYLYNYRKKKNNYIKFNQNNMANTILNSHNHTLYTEYEYPAKTHDMHINNIINLRKEKKVRFIETNDFIYYDPEESPQNLIK